jgi:sugar/nucleoside kinase (ribokinase family)
MTLSATAPQRHAIDVLGIGNAIVDIIAPTEDAVLAKHKLTKGWMRLIDENDIAALYADMTNVVEASGGSAANTIAGIGSLGGSGAFIGRVADDAFGKVYRDDIERAGVRYAGTTVPDGPGTGRSMILVTPDGQRTMNTFLGAASELGVDEVDQATISGAAMTYMEGYLFDRPPAKAAFRLAADLSHAAGRKVALTLSDSFCVERHRDDFLALIRGQADIVFANENELLALYPGTSFDAAVNQLSADAKLSAVTRSEHGSLIVQGVDRIIIAADPVDQVIDTTGAGDLYAAGFLFGLVHGRALPVCGQLGSIAAAAVLTQIGPRPVISLKARARERGVAM